MERFVTPIPIGHFFTPRNIFPQMIRVARRNRLPEGAVVPRGGGDTDNISNPGSFFVVIRGLPALLLMEGRGATTG